MSIREESTLQASVEPAVHAGRPSALQLEVARSILEHLCRRGVSVGNHLTEQELVDAFRVSRSPIRGALSYLAELGVVEKRPNRGYFIAKSGHELPVDIVKLPKTDDEELLIAVVEDRFEKRLSQSFSEAEFRRRYRLGKTTASRLLVRLSDNGIIARNRGHGWHFEPTLDSRATRDESYAYRMAIEPAAIRSPGFDLDREAARLCRRRHDMALEAGQDEPSSSTLVDIDAMFHRLIGISSRNRYFQTSIERQISLRRILEFATWTKVKDRVIESCTEHMRILDALERNEREEAAGMMRLHLAGSRELTAWRRLDETDIPSAG